MQLTKGIVNNWTLFNEGFGKYKPQILVLVVIGFLSGLLEAVGINAIIPLFSFVTAGPNQNPDIVTGGIQWFFRFAHIPFSLRFLLIFIVALFMFKALAMIAYHYINITITADFERQTREVLFGETLRAHWPYLLQQKIGYLEKILMNDIGNSTYLLKYFSQIILLVTSLIMYTIVSLNISPIITLLTFALGGIIFLFFKSWVYRTRLISSKFSDITKQVAHHINQNMIGIKTVKAHNAEDKVLKKGVSYFDLLKVLRVKNFFLQSMTGELMEPIALIFIVIVFAYSYQTPGFNFASFAVIIYLIQKIFAYIQNAQIKLQNINEFIPYLKSVVDTKIEARQNREEDSKNKSFHFEKSLEFRAVNFAYHKNRPILKNLNLLIHKGEMVGLIGPSGAGKTTIVDLLLRLFRPDSGRILIDGEDINQINLSAWRKVIGYVSQDIFLLNDTVENNVKFYDSTISEKEVIEACQLANIYDFVKNLPRGLKTVIGERGVLLSGGQRQRIILARVLARKPKILILDEATSSLDNESEVAIQKAIDDLKGKITVLIIAHRLTTVTAADRLLVLENGKIVEEGNPNKLLENKSSYFYKVFNIRENV